MKPVLLLLIIIGMVNRLDAQRPNVGYIEKLQPGLDDVLSSDAAVEVLDSGFQWAEGPLWVPQHQMLLFTDIPPNKVFKWTESEGTSLYLHPSGYTGKQPRRGEPGANGLVLMPDGKLLLCQHGDRRIALMQAPLDNPRPVLRALATHYRGKRFNSPNDALVTPGGAVLFTDPPYGLEKGMEDPAKELAFQGVYQWRAGQVRLLSGTLSRPNGILLLPDGHTLLVANSDEQKAVWYRFRYDPEKGLSDGRVLLDVTGQAREWGGMPDGLKCTRSGYVFATGPGGVWVFNPRLEVIGRIRLPVMAANVALGASEKVLYITATNYLLRVPLR